MAGTSDQSIYESAKDEAKSLGDELREKGSEAFDAASETAQDYADRAKRETYARGAEYRDYAAGETGKVAEALRKAAEDLAAGSPQERFIGQIADGVADAADRMRGMTLDEVTRDTAGFARRHPAAFLGGAALIGFAASRFLKASADDREERYLPAPGAPRYGSAQPAAAAHRDAALSSGPSGATAGSSGTAQPAPEHQNPGKD